MEEILQLQKLENEPIEDMNASPVTIPIIRTVVGATATLYGASTASVDC